MERRKPVERRGVWSGSEYSDFRGAGGALRLLLEGSDSPASSRHSRTRLRRVRYARFRPHCHRDARAGAPAGGGNKLTWEDRVELTRGLTAEYATVKVLLPRSKKALEFDSKGDYDKKQWTEIARESGPAARTGDLVQVTKIEIEDDKIVLQINGGFKGGRKWYQGVQIGMGGNDRAGEHE